MLVSRKRSPPEARTVPNRAPAPDGVAARGLDLEHRRAEPSQQRAREGTRNELAKLQHGSDVGQVELGLSPIREHVSDVDIMGELVLLHVIHQPAGPAEVETLPVEEEEHDVLYPGGVVQLLLPHSVGHKLGGGHEPRGRSRPQPDLGSTK